MRRLILLPERPGTGSGYQKAVAADLERICPTSADTVICYATSQDCQKDTGTRFVLLPRPSAFTPSRAVNLLSGKVSSELSASWIAGFATGKVWDEIICGEVIFYRALRQLFPGEKILVRFHNLFMVSQTRNRVLGYQLPLMARLNITLLVRLEKEILRDRKVLPVFITEEECNFFHMLYPGRAALVWPVVEAAAVSKLVVSIVPDSQRLVWFGSLSHHKKYALEYFIAKVYTPLKLQMPSLQLHVFGSGSERFNRPLAGISGHGYYSGEGFPFGGKALFINPDLLGGGIKLKIDAWLKNGIPFISTPYGVEGYKISESSSILIRDIDEWADAISVYFCGRQ